MFYVPDFEWTGNTKEAIEAEFEVCEVFADYVGREDAHDEDFVVYECNGFDDDGWPVDITQTWVINVYHVGHSLEFSWKRVNADYIAGMKNHKDRVFEGGWQSRKIDKMLRNLEIGASGVKS